MDIRAALAKPATAQKFATAFIDAYLSPAFGARSKSEIDLLVFGALIDARAIDPGEPVYDIARAPNLSPARVRSLLLNWQLRSTPAQADLRASIVDVLKKTRFSKDGTLLTFGIESPLLREDVSARLKRRGVFPDASFSKDILKLPVDAFVEFLDDVIDENTKQAVRATLVNDKQLPDKSFKALATSILTKLGEKVVGEYAAGLVKDLIGPAAKKTVGFVTGLLNGNVEAATKSITKDDYPSDAKGLMDDIGRGGAPRSSSTALVCLYCIGSVTKLIMGSSPQTDFAKNVE